MVGEAVGSEVIGDVDGDVVGSIVVGDTDGDMVQDSNEPNFVRHRAEYGQVELIGRNDEITICVVSVRGDTEGEVHDVDRDLTNAGSWFDENPGSIALVVRLGDFEL